VGGIGIRGSGQGAAECKNRKFSYLWRITSVKPIKKAI
jgi:hypothetical protein